MPKRKRDGRVMGQNGPSQEDRKRAELEREIQLGRRQLTRNLKLAKGFERQKLGRREKDARAKKDGTEVAKIEAEIQALKNIDIPMSAQHHLYKTLHKNKAINRSNLLPSTVQLPPRSTIDTATANVTARMYNAKLVKDAMIQTLIALRSIIGIHDKNHRDLKIDKAEKVDQPRQQKESGKEGKGTRTKAVWQASPTFLSSSGDESGLTDGSGEVTLPSESEGSDVEREEASDEFDSDAYGAFDARIASSSSSEEENEASNGKQDDSVIAAQDSQLKRELLSSVAKAGLKTSRNTSTKTARDATSVDSEEMAGCAQLDGASDLSSTKRPVKTAAVAKRMIFAHLGIKQDRTQGLSSSKLSDKNLSNEDNSPVADSDPAVVGSNVDLDEQISPGDSDDLQLDPPSKRIRESLHNSSKTFAQSNADAQILKRKHLSPPRLSRSGRRAVLKNSSEVHGDDTSSESDAAIRIPAPKIRASKDSKSKAAKEDQIRLKKEDKAALKAQKSAKSTFLPSLADGAYWSGSESAPSDIEEHVAPRKNRRGQRARQAIAEKKHGKAAKHLQAEAKKKSRGDGWDAKRGATSRDDGWRKGKGATWKGTDASGISSSNAIPVTAMPEKVRKRTKDDEGPLHPSWEAKKNAKTKDGLVPFQGKKITFD